MRSDIDWDDLTFSIVPTDEMYMATAPLNGDWREGAFVPYGDITISPAAGVLNYGQGIFEGLKAHRTRDNNIVLFRPAENAKRFAEGAERVCMPSFPVGRFVEVVEEVVRRNASYIPPCGKGSLYVRPVMWGTGPILGLAPAPEYTMAVYTSPVGAYFKKKKQSPLKLEVCTAYHRSAAKGMGSTKYIGNYAGEMYHSLRAKAKGLNGCIYLDARDEHIIEEVGAANFFCVLNGKLLTPSLGSILPGITRASIIQLAREVLGMDVEERAVSVDEMLAAEECFCTGTAAVIAPIGQILHAGEVTTYQNNTSGPVSSQLYDMLTKIQLSEAEDTFGWVHQVDMSEAMV